MSSTAKDAKDAKEFRIIVRTAEEGGYWAEIPNMPGCATQGEDIADLFANVAEAIDGWASTDTDD